MDHTHLDAIIHDIWLRGHDSFELQYSESLIQQLCPVASQIFLKEPILLELQAPIKIAACGDLYHHKLFWLTRFNIGLRIPSQSSYLFLGNYADIRGDFLNTILLFLAYKIRFPENFFLLKGNLDEAGIRPFRIDGIDEPGIIHYSSQQILNDCLKSLPVAALINEEIVCTHRGLSPDLHNLDQIKLIKRPSNLPLPPLLLDLLGPNPRNVNHHGNIFLEKEVAFLQKHNLRLICCGDQVVHNRDDFAVQRVFSLCSSYCALKQTEFPTMMSLDENLMCSFHDYRHKRALWSYHLPRRTATVNKHVELAESTRKPNSGSSSGTMNSESTPGTSSSKFDFDPNSSYRSKSPGVMPAARMNTPYFKSSTESTTKSESSSATKVVNFTNIPNSERTSATTTFGFDPNSLYRSKLPGVKRFLGARV